MSYICSVIKNKQKFKTMTRNAEINLKALYTNKVIALRKFEKWEAVADDELFYNLNERCDDTARWFAQGVERHIEEGNTHPMEVIRKMAEWDKFIAERINHKDNEGLI